MTDEYDNKLHKALVAVDTDHLTEPDVDMSELEDLGLIIWWAELTEAGRERLHDLERQAESA